jgi:Ca2+-binding RTX toxin-like protein
MTSVTVIAAAIGALALPSAAQAASASSDGSTIRVSSGPEALEVGIITAPAQPGALYITYLTDVGIEPGAGCVSVRMGVNCRYTGTPTVVVDLGDGDDSMNVTADGPMTIHVSGGPGDDRLYTTTRTGAPPNTATATLDGGPGDDRFDVAGGVADTIIGGQGTDEATYWLSTGPTAITLNGVADDGVAGEGDNVGGDIEELVGALRAPNTIVGNDAPQKLAGHAQADTLDGGGGNDFLTGEAGDDVLIGGAGDDALLAGDGNDRLDGGPGYDRLYGYAGDDLLVARDGERDEQVACDDGGDTAIVDLVLDELAVQDCERVDRAWVAAPTLTTGTSALRARRGRLHWALTCRAAAGRRCEGRLRIATATCVRSRGRCRKLVLGRAHVDLAANQRRRITVRLSRPARRLLLRRGKVACLARASLAGSGGLSARVVVRAR